MRPVVFGAGSSRYVGVALDELGASRVFLVTGQRSYEASGAERALEAALTGRQITRFRALGDYPDLPDVQRGIRELRGTPCDAVVAVGGGTALDTGKLINLLAAHEGPAETLVRSRTLAARAGLPLIAVPTTAGSGSEATHFGVVYADRIKHSVASPFMLPNVSVVDPGLTMTVSPRQTAISGMDALAQAVESYWSIHSRDDSRRDARRALERALAHLTCAVTAPTPRHRRAMSKAAYFAGRAINVTRTTAAHAVSYPLTAHYGVAHGHAVALTLGEFLVYNSRVSDADVTDPRGARHVQQVVRELLQMLGCDTAEAGRERIRAMMRAIGLATQLSAIGIDSVAASELIGQEVNVERMVNNPRALNRSQLGGILAGIS